MGSGLSKQDNDFIHVIVNIYMYKNVNYMLNIYIKYIILCLI